MTRIVGGRYSGRRLTTPAGGATRPTAEKVRAAIANSLQASGAAAGAAVLDLFAGSGALGLELLSRGAASLVAVDKNRSALVALRANVHALGVQQVTIREDDVLSFAVTAGERFDIVVADPPYDLPDTDLSDILTALVNSGRLAPGADIVLERSARAGEFAWPSPLVGRRSKRYGDTMISYGVAP